MMHQQACKLASSMDTTTCKLASSMTMRHQQDHMTTTLNPSAKPFLPPHKNYNPSQPSYNTLPAATPLPSIIHQSYVYCYQPCLSQPQPPPQYYAANLYNPGSFVAPKFFGSTAPFSVPNMEYHSSTSGAPLRASILNQIEYYFSDENLEHDVYLISLMDDKGWVPISTIANFNRVKAMCTSIPFILESLVVSSIVEVQGKKIRRRHDWPKWISKQNKDPQGEVESSNKFALNESVNEIVTDKLSELVLEGRTEAGGDCNKTIAANSVLTEPVSTTPLKQQGQVQIMPSSTPLSCMHDMVEGKEHSERSSSSKYFEKTTQSSRTLLDLEFVRSYLAKGDEVKVEAKKIRRRYDWSEWISSAMITKQKNKATSVVQQPALKEIMPLGEGKENSESSLSSKYFEKTQSSESLLDFEFVRSYLARGDEVLSKSKHKSWKVTISY